MGSVLRSQKQEFTGARYGLSALGGYSRRNLKQASTHLKREQIKEKYENLKITGLQLYAKKVHQKEKLFMNIQSRYFIAEINSSLYWLINYGQSGHENLIGFDKASMVEQKSVNQNFQIIKTPASMKVRDLLSIIDQVKEKVYDSQTWNNEVFTKYFIEQIQKMSFNTDDILI